MPLAIASSPAGKLLLPVCTSCAAVQFPPREFCGECLGEVAQAEVDNAGTVVASTGLLRSNDPRFDGELPLTIGSVKLASGPVVLAFLPARSAKGDSVCLRVVTGKLEQPVLEAIFPGG